MYSDINLKSWWEMRKLSADNPWFFIHITNYNIMIDYITII